MFLKAISLTAYDSTSALKIGSIYTPPILSPPSKYKGTRTQARRFAILVSRLSVKYKVNWYEMNLAMVVPAVSL